jgi:hypothetical protein
MATSGPEHYRRAECAAGEATELLAGPGGDIAAAAVWAALAQAHATLADTAASIATHLGMTAATEETWRDATGLTRPAGGPSSKAPPSRARRRREAGHDEQQ